MNTLLFQSVFGARWNDLPSALQKHYAMRPASHDTVALEGVMQFEASRRAQLLSPLLRLGGMPPLCNACDVPATVQLSAEGEAGIRFDRQFRFLARKPVSFRTLMQSVGNGILIDWTRARIGWRMEMTYESGRVFMRHRGYCLRWGNNWVKLPLEWWLGECNAWEEAVDDNRFSMSMEIRRKGKLFYAYSGVFSIKGVLRRD